MLPLIRHHLRRASLLVWLALFGLVAAPTVSRALAAADPLGYAAICSSTGGSAGGPGASLEHVGQHCALCGAAAQAVLPAPALAVPRLALARHEEPAALALPIAARPLWPTAPPRGPPLSA